MFAVLWATNLFKKSSWIAGKARQRDLESWVKVQSARLAVLKHVEQ